MVKKIKKKQKGVNKLTWKSKVIAKKILRKQKPVTVRFKQYKPAEYRSLYLKKEWANAEKFYGG